VETSRLVLRSKGPPSAPPRNFWTLGPRRGGRRVQADSDAGGDVAPAPPADADPPTTPPGSPSPCGAAAGSSRGSSPDRMAGLGNLFEGLDVKEEAATDAATTTVLARPPPPPPAFVDETVAPGADLAACLAAFFAAEDVEWSCPALVAAHEAAAAAKPADGGSPPSSPSTPSRPLSASLRRSVSFCESGPSIHVVPGSAEQRGTDFERAARGEAAFRRPLRHRGVCLLLTAEADAASRDVVHVALHPYDDDEATAGVLPDSVAVASVPIERVEDSDDEAEQARLRGAAQTLMDCTASMVHAVGVAGMRRMTGDGMALERDAGGAWRVRGMTPPGAGGPGGPWSWPAGDAASSPSPSPSPGRRAAFVGPGSPPARAWVEEAGGDEEAQDAAAASAPPPPPAAAHGSCTKRYALHAAPPLLTLHLKRFARDARGRLRKLGGHVAFPLTLALRDVAPPTALATLPPDVAARRYELVGAVEHMGGMGGGHYIAFVRRDGKDGAAAWFRASDSHVGAVGEDEVRGCEAYILLYARRDVEEV